jgi:hypothetical protein
MVSPAGIGTSYPDTERSVGTVKAYDVAAGAARGDERKPHGS